MQAVGYRRRARLGDRTARRRRRVAAHTSWRGNLRSSIPCAGDALDRVVTDGGAGSGHPATDLAAAAHRTGRVGGGVSVSLQRTSGSAAPRCRRPRCAFRPIWPARSAGTPMSDAPHDEPSWLIRVQRTIPELRVIQLPDVLSIYNVHGTSVSRDPSDRTDDLHRVGTAVSGHGVAARARRLPMHQSGQRGGVRAIVRRGAARVVVGGTTRPARPLRARRMRLSTRPGSSSRSARLGHPAMTVDQGRLAPEERRALLHGPLYRILGTPVVALLGLANTAIIVRETGEAVFGLVSLVATITLLFPFADLGIGATVLNASARAERTEPGPERRRRHSSRLPRAVRCGRGAGCGRALRHGARRLGRCSSASPAGPTIVGRSPSRRASSRSRFRPASGSRILDRYRPESVGHVGVDELPGVCARVDRCCCMRSTPAGSGTRCRRWAACSSASPSARCWRCACPASGWSAFARVSPPRTGPGLLAGQHVAVRGGGRAAGRLADRAGSARTPVDARGAVALRLDGADLRRRVGRCCPPPGWRIGRSSSRGGQPLKRRFECGGDSPATLRRGWR